MFTLPKLQTSVYSDSLNNPQNPCNSNNDNDQELILKTYQLNELKKFTKLLASNVYKEIKMTDAHLLAALNNPSNGLFSLHRKYRGEQSNHHSDEEKIEFAKNIWNQCNAAFNASRKRNRDENKMQMHDGNGNWILKKHEITLSGPNESALYTEMVAVIANHRGFFDMRIIEQEEGRLEDKIEDLEKELKESAKRRNEDTGYQEIYPHKLSNLVNSRGLGKFQEMVNNLEKYKLVDKIDLVRIIWEKCNSAFLAGEGAYDKKTGYWLLDKHEIELPFMIDNELFTKLKVEANANPKTNYFNFSLTLPEQKKQDLTEQPDSIEPLRSAQSGQPRAPQNLA